MLTRRLFLSTSTAALAAGTVERLLALQPPQQPPAPATPVVKDLRRSTGIFTARGGTIGWLINANGVVAVDSQFPDTAQQCVDELLKKSGKTDIATLVNTHHHGDHTGGNGVFRPKTKQIVAHANVPKYLKMGYDAAMAKRAQITPPPTTPAPAEPAAIDRTVTDGLTLEHGDERISIKHYGPAHTGGDVVIYFERANVAHMGDLMFNRAHPVIDRAVIADAPGRDLPVASVPDLVVLHLYFRETEDLASIRAILAVLDSAGLREDVESRLSFLPPECVMAWQQILEGR